MIPSAIDERLERILAPPKEKVKHDLGDFLESPTDANEEKIKNSLNNFSEKLREAGHSDRANEYKNVAVNFGNAKDKNTKITIARALANVMLRLTVSKIIFTSIGVLGTAGLLAHIAVNGTVVSSYDANFDGVEDARGISTGDDGHVDHYVQDTNYDGTWDTVADAGGDVEATGPLVECLSNLFYCC